MYQAIIARVQVKPIPGANAIAAGTCCGYSVIVSKDTPDGALGVYFPVGGQLSREMCMANRLYRKHPDTGEEMGGHIEDNRRVRTKRFMGIEAEGLWLPLESLDWAIVTALDGDKPTPDLSEGFTFTDLAGVDVCQRYMPRFVRSARTAEAGGKVKSGREVPGFPMHFDTGQLRMNLGQLRIGDRLIIGEKLHGTSGRTGCVLEAIDLPWYKRAANRVAGWIGRKPIWQNERVATYSGTRRCLLDATRSGEAGKPYRVVAHELIAPHLRVGECVYYEIVGFESDGRPIMPPHEVPEKMQKQLGPVQVYSYGCAPPTADPDVDPGHWLRPVPFRIFIYRITDHGRDLTQSEMAMRLAEIGSQRFAGSLEFCPQILTYTYDGNAERLMEICKALCDGKAAAYDWSTVPGIDIHVRDGLAGLRKLTVKSALDSTHIREGVCVRIERNRLAFGTDSDGNVQENDIDEFVTILKYKGWLFCHFEDIRPNSDEAVDPEEMENAFK